MKKQLFTLSLIAALSVSAAACNKADLLSPGHYEGETESKDASGTKTTKKMSTDVTTDAYGNKTAVTKTRKTTDPKGLFNKSTSTTKDVEKSNY